MAGESVCFSQGDYGFMSRQKRALESLLFCCACKANERLPTYVIGTDKTCYVGPPEEKYNYKQSIVCEDDGSGAVVSQRPLIFNGDGWRLRRGNQRNRKIEELRATLQDGLPKALRLTSSLLLPKVRLV